MGIGLVYFGINQRSFTPAYHENSRKKFKKFLKKVLYNGANSCYDKQAGLKSDAVTMPAAQFREKAVFFAVHHPPFTWREVNYFKRWI